MALKPLQDRIVIKVIEDTEQTSGGIFIPDSAKEKPQRVKLLLLEKARLTIKAKKNLWALTLGILSFMLNMPELM